MPGLVIRRVISFKLRVWAGPTTRVTWSQAPITRPPYLTILARDGHFGGEHGLLGIFDMASLKGINIPFRERIQNHVITKTLLSWAERRIEDQQSHETGANEKDWHRDSGFRGGRGGHLRGECYFSGRSPDTSGSGQDRPGTTPRDGAQVITRWEAQNVIRMCETIILELFTLGLALSHPGQAPPSVLHLPGGARAVFSQQDISSFATRSLHYRVISFLLFSHQRKYYLFTINIQENMMTEM